MSLLIAVKEGLRPLTPLCAPDSYRHSKNLNLIGISSCSVPELIPYFYCCLAALQLAPDQSSVEIFLENLSSNFPPYWLRR